jgi:hypothetical protein
MSAPATTTEPKEEAHDEAAGGGGGGAGAVVDDDKQPASGAVATLACPVCLDNPMHTPVVFDTCGHMYCSACARMARNTHPPGARGILQCGVCRQAVNKCIVVHALRDIGYVERPESPPPPPLPLPPPAPLGGATFTFDAPGRVSLSMSSLGGEERSRGGLWRQVVTSYGRAAERAGRPDAIPSAISSSVGGGGSSVGAYEDRLSDVLSNFQARLAAPSRLVSRAARDLSVADIMKLIPQDVNSWNKVGVRTNRSVYEYVLPFRVSQRDKLKGLRDRLRELNVRVVNGNKRVRGVARTGPLPHTKLVMEVEDLD